MGAVRFDIEAGHRQKEEIYALDTVEGVHCLLRDYHEISERRYKGDLAAVDILIDLGRAIKRARLTPRQREAMNLYYIRCLTQEEAADVMGIEQHTLTAHLRGGVKKVAAVFARWKYGTE
jgi:DNA-directed RNA polymerase specialized sigma24 family protein